MAVETLKLSSVHGIGFIPDAGLVSSAGFIPEVLVSSEIVDATPYSTTLTVETAEVSGEKVIAFKVPTVTLKGVHWISLLGGRSGRVVTTIEVRGAPAAPEPKTSGLAAPGVNTAAADFLLLGAVTLALVVVHRRRLAARVGNTVIPS